MYLCLQIHLRVPVGVKENDNVSCGQVDAQASCPGGQHEDKFLTVGLVVLINVVLQTDRQTDRQTNRQIDTYSGRQMYRLRAR